ncbi:hypothetical protein ccbrp13_50870 [Ktedonobacteria bacterium brp13]|nr:hypothetical protein ccbrp13_50870 [Ktedonobacteria bacterium brp13]
MSDEQTIYISPDDDLTTVRERLEQAQSRNVTLIVPAQTQLRSHVAWKLLYARARELGKEVLIVSSDPQVRSVAHAVKFTVAHSLETTQQVYSRPASRQTRASMTRNPRNGAPIQRTSTTNAASSISNTIKKRNTIRENSTGYRSNDSEDDEIQDLPASSTYEDLPSQRSQASQHPSHPSHPLHPSHSLPYNSTPSIHPLSAEEMDEEPDMLAEDYQRARRLRGITGHPGQHNTARSKAPLDDDQDEPVEHTPAPQASRSAANKELGIPQTNLREQRGHAFIEGFDTNEHSVQHNEIEGVDDIANYQTTIEPHHIEYVDDDDVVIPNSAPSSAYQRKEPAPSEEQQPIERLSRSSTPARRPRSTGYVSPGKSTTNRPWQEALENDDDLPMEERPTHVEERNAMAYDAPSRTGREPRPVQLPIGVDLPVDTRGEREERGERGEPRSISARGAGSSAASKRGTGTDVLRSLKRSPSSPPPTPLTPSTARNASEAALRKSRKQPAPLSHSGRAQNRGRTRSVATTILVAIGIVCVIVLLAVMIPTSDITLVLATHAYSHPLTVSASSNPASATNGIILARTIKQDFTRQGLEPATGSKMIDTGQAGGYVCFSFPSGGPSAVTIPTNTIITTADGVQFKVTAESAIIAGTTCSTGPAPDPIVALQTGETGNVQAGAINTIPQSSLVSIAQRSNTTVANISGLKVVNLDKTTGGGRQQVSAITASDLQHAQSDLHKQEQGNIDTWLKSLPNNGLAGKPIITDALVNPPAVGSAVTGNATTFQAGVEVTVTVLFVSYDDLREAAILPIDTTLRTDKKLQNYTVPNNNLHAVQITNAKIIASTDSTLKISYTASANVVSTIDANQIRQISAGKAPAVAQQAIQAQYPGVTQVNITTDPVLFPHVAYWGAHINVKTVPVHR